MNVSEILSGVAAIATVVAAIVAICSLRLLARDSWDRSRPYVYVQPVPGLWGGGAADLRVVNHGQSLARIVKVEVIDFDWGAAGDDYLIRALDAGIRGRKFDLPPGAAVRFMWRNTSSDGSRFGMPDEQWVQIRYVDVRNKSHVERFLISNSMAKAMPTPVVGPERKSGESGVREIANVSHAIRALNNHVGELRR